MSWLSGHYISIAQIQGILFWEVHTFVHIINVVIYGEFLEGYMKITSIIDQPHVL